MAVEVVGESADEKLRVNCDQCSAVLEYVRADIEPMVTGRTLLEYGGPVYYVTCPRCSSRVAAAR